MSPHIKARVAAVVPAASQAYRRFFTVLGGLVLAAALSGCQQTVPQAGPDPADPGAKVPATGYRSTTASYQSMRPAAPAAWSGRGAGTPATDGDRR